MHWHIDQRRTCLRCRLVEEAEDDVIALTNTPVAIALSHIAGTQVAEEVRGERPVPASCKTLRVITREAGCGLARILEASSLGAFPEIASHELTMTVGQLGV